ncbi:5-oxoprolinase/urea amidolyase family protein [Nakamurella flavida]|uniref:5-oxoprolinase/urea amidolyase family protein n=1 Tax=Nakamurella flavida TaxID=363630 RepID=A0A938YES8_9ACTN|nr:5-oxoprolinase/urea amidolyase family protein [Nakamurella flavida]MBM9476345.1 5-oxoprolinase/urea amidolyase family protein [Nakamurella flavida]MDP9779555.1 urea carboxylase [Nakamurella flavida]
MSTALETPVSAVDPAGAAGITVLRPGVQTTVQDAVGRTGYWDVGVPPSGAFDRLSFALAARAVGNADDAAGLECVVSGPTLQFGSSAVICLAGAATAATLDGEPVPVGVPTPVPAGGVLTVGKIAGPGLRGYVAIAGGIDVPTVLGSRSTFVLGKFGGPAGRALAKGDELPLGVGTGSSLDVSSALPTLTTEWELRVVPGPHGAPVHLDPAGPAALFAATWTVDHRSDRTGVRLTGPTPRWARTDGGEAGLHPSNVHDSAYPVGGIMLSGDTPVIVGPDGPSLGGFVVPCAVIAADLWKVGQFRAGDRVRLVPVDLDTAAELGAARAALLADPGSPVAEPTVPTGSPDLATPLGERPATGHHPAITVRAAGDRHVLVEAGALEFDLTVRMWIHLLARGLHADRPAGVTEIVEGVRSLLVGARDHLGLPELADHLMALAAGVADPAAVTLDVREVTLPIAFDHPGAHEAMARYQASVNPTAPWCPDNVEFIRRINDLGERDEVFDVMIAATYLVVGLGDVYLGAPVAVPLDPRHRLVTTKYNPARTWTPQNAVGIGGIYLCVYGMEGPGGYQLVGRTVPVWRLAEETDTAAGTEARPWLLRPFDRLRFVPVTTDELEATRADILAGRADLRTRPATFSLAEVAALQDEHAAEITALRAHRRRAFDDERARWESAS